MKLLILIFFCTTLSFAQELKKKFFGKYEGIIPTYKVELNNVLLDVKETQIEIEFLASNLVKINVGGTIREGSYVLKTKSRKEFFIECTFNGEFTNEKIHLIKKGKKLIRIGMNPQPTAILFKKK